MAALVEIPSELKDLRELYRNIDKDEPDLGDSNRLGKHSKADRICGE